MLLYFLLFVMLAVAFAAIVASIYTRRKAALAAVCLHNMEQRYEQFLEDNLSEELWVEGIFITSVERLAKDAVYILRKEILELSKLTQGSYPYSQVEIPFRAAYFPNVVSLAEEELYKSHHSPTQQAHQSPPETRFSEALLEAIETDLQQRLVNKPL